MFEPTQRISTPTHNKRYKFPFPVGINRRATPIRRQIWRERILLWFRYAIFLPLLLNGAPTCPRTEHHH
ncbi:hypothetical protein MUK42_30091 [Musa troglodytarum]|uniref:Uncharacterized protein n=1 Tax=Musa troglodytarum TaxID=320322 RepID=A0A9E7JN91_9LILI|nr:hypothetical protein MUK42_30091 [Musa troglodytarum]